MDNGRRGVRLLVSTLTIVIAIAVLWVALTTAWMWRYQERVVFQPPTVEVEAPAPARRVTFQASDGQELLGYVVEPHGPGSREPRTVVIAFHGNADLAAWTVPWAAELADRARVTVFVPEYRGYGGLSGEPSYTSVAADARGALEFVRAELRPSRVALYGHSLGSAIAAELAGQMTQGPSALVLASPFTSARDMAMRMLVPPIPWLWERVSRVHYDTRGVVARLESPVYVSHGTRDINIPARMGRLVFEAARRPGELLIVDGAGHNDVADVGGERYWRWLVSSVTRDR